MQLKVSAIGVDLTEALLERVERRIRFAVRSFEWVVERVHVRLSDADGSKGGVDTTCSVIVWLIGLEPVQVGVTDADIRTAIDCSAHCTRRAVARKLDRTLKVMLDPRVVNPMRGKQ